ncbi:MAG: hypothetical protein M3Q80_00975, partial [bacterium]|nr:hypothetical protein [bacterium]
DHAKPFLPEWIVPNSDTFKKIIPVLKDKISTFKDVTDVLSLTGELGFVHRISEYPKESLLWKKNPDPKVSEIHLRYVRDLLESLSEEGFTSDTIKSVIYPYAEIHGKGDVLWPLRMALTGQDKSPDPFMSAALLGKVEALSRFDVALSKLI